MSARRRRRTEDFLIPTQYQETVAQHQAAARALRDWLCQVEWHIFLTQTFRFLVSPEGLRSTLCSFLADTHSSLVPLTAAFIASEYHETGRLHAHALVAVQNSTELRRAWMPPRRSSPKPWGRTPSFARSSTRSSGSSRSTSSSTTGYMHRWKELAWRRLGMARPFLIRDSKAMAVWYTTKYVAKDMTSVDNRHSEMNGEIRWWIWTPPERRCNLLPGSEPWSPTRRCPMED